MAGLAESFSAVELTPEDFKGVSGRLREKLKATEEPGDDLREWMLIGARSRGQREIVRRVVAAVGRIAEHRLKEMSERNIETLVDLYLEGEERTDVDREIEQDNAGLRARYLLETPAWTAADIHGIMHGEQLSNPSEPASRWKREGRVFAVRAGRAYLFPRFQFADGAPRPVVKEVLKRLPGDMTPWQIAFWFRSGNGWLDGKSPEETLDDGDSVLTAADRLSEPAIG